MLPKLTFQCLSFDQGLVGDVEEYRSALAIIALISHYKGTARYYKFSW